LRELLANQRIVTAWPDEYLDAVVERMMTMNVAQVPVISRTDGQLVGTIGWKDLLRVRARLQAEETQRTVFYRLVRARRPQPAIAE
jgi:predicted transcriptional regulator